MPTEDAFVLAPNERLFLGEGLFETIKVSKSQACFSKLHWQRLKRSAQFLELPFKLSFAAWQQMLCHKIQQEQLVDGGLKVILTGGIAARGLIAQGEHNQYLVQAFSFSPQTKALRLKKAAWLRDGRNPLYQLKTINYLEAIVARRQAQDEGWDDVLFFNMHNCVTEASCANIFFLYQDRLITPALSDGVLAGVTRSRIVQHCQLLNLAFAELSISATMLEQAQAAFLSNSLQGIQQIAAFEQQEFSLNHPSILRLIDSLIEEERAYCLSNSSRG